MGCQVVRGKQSTKMEQAEILLRLTAQLTGQTRTAPTMVLGKYTLTEGPARAMEKTREGE